MAACQFCRGEISDADSARRITICRTCAPPPYECAECGTVQSDWPDYCPQCSGVLTDYGILSGSSEVRDRVEKQAERFSTKIEAELSRGATKEDITAELASEGWDEETAREFVDEASSRTLGYFMVGTVLLVVGGGVTLGTYLAAGPSGTYIVTTGALFLGVGSLLAGFWRLIFHIAREAGR